MTERHETDLPPEVQQIFERLWPMKQPIVVHILPRDAWIALGIIQFATRNPALSARHRQLIEQFGRELQRSLVAIEPRSEKYLEMGWNSEFDQPR
jgi:hypothetical protein